MQPPFRLVRAADRILAEHVASCGRCRTTLNELQAVSGDLALAAAPVDPPETLLPRIHRAIDEVPLAGRTPRRGALVAVAASAVALVALGGLSLVLGNRLSDAQTRAGTAREILSAMRSPGAQPVHVTPQDETPPESGVSVQAERGPTRPMRCSAARSSGSEAVADGTARRV